MPELRQKFSALTNVSSKEKPGMVSEIKCLYQGKPDSNGRRAWVESIPDDLPEPVENEKSARFALLIRKVRCYDGRRSLSIQSIVIQSPLIRDALKNVLDNYPGITTGIDRMEVKPPFQAFVHRWDKLESVLQAEQDPTTKAHLHLLRDAIHGEISNDITIRDNLLEHKVIDFDHLWMLFEPGCIICSSSLGQPCAYRLQTCNLNAGAGRCYVLHCQFVDWNGESFGYAQTSQTIHNYEGTCPISKLSTFPLKYHPHIADITDRLVARGKEFERLSGYHYRAYNGIAIAKGLFGQTAYNVRAKLESTVLLKGLQTIRSIAVSSLIPMPGIDLTLIHKSLPLLLKGVPKPWHRNGLKKTSMILRLIL